MTPNEAALAAKINAVNAIARRHLWPDWFRCLCLDRMAAGHKLHGADASAVSCAREALEELADAGNYGAIGRVQGCWSRGWSLMAWLVGIGARLVRKEVEPIYTRVDPGTPEGDETAILGDDWLMRFRQAHPPTQEDDPKDEPELCRLARWASRWAVRVADKLPGDPEAASLRDTCARIFEIAPAVIHNHCSCGTRVWPGNNAYPSPSYDPPATEGTDEDERAPKGGPE